MKNTLANLLNDQKPVPFKALWKQSCKWVYTIMNIFSALRVYAGKWSEKNVRPFAPEEISAVEKAEVVESQYGSSVCFSMISGGQTYLPLDQNSSLGIGSLVDLTKAQLVTLQRPGEQDIYRVRA